jgi:hypothetical protein
MITQCQEINRNLAGSAPEHVRRPLQPRRRSQRANSRYKNDINAYKAGRRGPRDCPVAICTEDLLEGGPGHVTVGDGGKRPHG